MKILTSKTDRNTGVRTMTIELDKSEKLVAIHDNSFYKLGEPLDDVVQGHIIADATVAVWCPIEQKFIT